MVNRSKIAIIGVPQDLGASRRGVDMGPMAIRVAGLHNKIESLGYEIKDYGNLHCHDMEEEPSDEKISNPKLRYLPYIIDTCGHLKDAIQDALTKEFFPLIIGGDHSITIGTLAGMRNLHNGKTGIIWVDAHGDFNTDSTTVSGNIHGMPFAVITGRGHKSLLEIGPSPTVIEKNSVLIAARDLDPAEQKLLNESDVTVFTMKDIDEHGMANISSRAIEIATNGVDNLHVSFDIDSLDPTVAPGTGTRVIGGLTYREAHLLMELVHDTGKLVSFDMLEVNPTLDVRNKTAELAVGLIGSALGSKII
ncbi:MAG: arginase [Candidatus Heimdallarchaeota archaeon]|nr:arginase [Candidatus Heimdallarchaeota archaeon]